MAAHTFTAAFLAPGKECILGGFIQYNVGFILFSIKIKITSDGIG